MNRRLRTPLLFGLIGSSVIFICALVGLIGLSNYRNFFEFYESYLGQEITEGMTIEEIILQMYPAISTSTIRIALYYFFIFSNVLSMLLSIPCIVFSLICFKDTTLTAEEFQKRNKLHIFLLISFGLSYLASSYEMGSTAFSALSIFSLAAVVFIFIGFFKSLQVVRLNKYVLKVRKSKKAYEEKLRQEQERKAQEESFVQSTGNQIGEENLTKPEIKEETVTPVDQVKLDELYSLLSKLEKSYKNGEVSQEDYERMKKTILENYMK